MSATLKDREWSQQDFYSYNLIFGHLTQLVWLSLTPTDPMQTCTVGCSLAAEAQFLWSFYFFRPF